MSWTTRQGGPDGFPWVVERDGVPVAAAPDESGAARLAHLLGSWADPSRAPAPAAVGGQRVPFAGTRPASLPERLIVRAATGREIDAVPVRPTATAPDRDPGEEERARWEGVATGDAPAPLREPDGWRAGGASVERLPDGRWLVRFEAKPPAEVRAELKAAGYWWIQAEAAWVGRASPPVRFLPVFGGAR